MFSSLAILLSISSTLEGQVGASTFYLAVAAYLSVYPVLLLVPTVALLCTIKGTKLLPTAIHTTATFCVSFGFMLYASFLWLGSLNFVSATYSITFMMTELTPNIGLWWYFFTEMFEDFRSFFLVVFQLHLVIYVLPLCIKLRYGLP